MHTQITANGAKCTFLCDLIAFELQFRNLPVAFPRESPRATAQEISAPFEHHALCSSSFRNERDNILAKMPLSSFAKIEIRPDRKVHRNFLLLFSADAFWCCFASSDRSPGGRGVKKLLIAFHANAVRFSKRSGRQRPAVRTHCASKVLNANIRLNQLEGARQIR